MNVKNNKRQQETTERIDAAFTSLLRNKELTKITVTEICETADVDRSTFYAHY